MLGHKIPAYCLPVYCSITTSQLLTYLLTYLLRSVRVDSLTGTGCSKACRDKPGFLCFNVHRLGAVIDLSIPISQHKIDRSSHLQRVITQLYGCARRSWIMPVQRWRCAGFCVAIRPENILQSVDVDGGKPWQQAVCHETASQQKIYCSLGIDAVIFSH